MRSLVRNTLRTVHVPWPAIESVEGRYGLRLRHGVRLGDGLGCQPPRRSAASPGPAEPVGRASSRHGSRSCAPRATSTTDAWRAPHLRTSWHREIIAALALLAVATVVLPLLS